MNYIFAAIFMLLLASPAMAQIAGQPAHRDLTPDGFPAGKQGHCWACMHGCTPKQDAEFCGWPVRNTVNQPMEPEADRRCGPYGCMGEK
jgi:hypothetical protein